MFVDTPQTLHSEIKVMSSYWQKMGDALSGSPLDSLWKSQS